MTRRTNARIASAAFLLYIALGIAAMILSRRASGAQGIAAQRGGMEEAMWMTYVVHIVAGSLGLVSGFVALYVVKGATAHRRAGTVFVYAILATCVAGFAIAALKGVAPAVNIPAASLTACMVITAVTTLRSPTATTHWLERGATVVTLVVALASLTFAAEAFANGGKRNGMPAFPFVMFGVVGMLATVGDIRVMRFGRRRGASRLARHLWRMSFALFIAALSFFIGQAQVIPKPIRIPPLLALPVLTVLVAMFYWLWRVRIGRSLRGIVVVRTPEAA